MNYRDTLKLVASLILTFSAAAIGSLATTAQSNWYRNLTKPSFNPPGWIFGPVWTGLYILMAVAFFMIWRRGFADRRGRIALTCFLVQLVLNAVWTLLFFGLQSPLAALLDIAFLLVAIVLTIWAFARISKAAAWLLAPYLCWVAFAAVLNGSIWWLNR